jgi:hypothetical protein
MGVAVNDLLRLRAVVFLFLLLSGVPAYAYLDPVTGSLIVQGLVALIAGIIAGIKTIRLKVIGFFTSLFGRKGP